MDLIIALVALVVGPFAALALAAPRFAADSRLTIDDRAARWI
jgi:hypothetical protein